MFGKIFRILAVAVAVLTFTLSDGERFTGGGTITPMGECEQPGGGCPI